MGVSVPPEFGTARSWLLRTWLPGLACGAAGLALDQAWLLAIAVLHVLTVEATRWVGSLRHRDAPTELGMLLLAVIAILPLGTAVATLLIVVRAVARLFGATAEIESVSSFLVGLALATLLAAGQAATYLVVRHRERRSA